MAQTALDDARVGILAAGSPHYAYVPSSIQRNCGFKEDDADLTDLTEDRDCKQNVGTSQQQCSVEAGDWWTGEAPAALNTDGARHIQIGEYAIA